MYVETAILANSCVLFYVSSKEIIKNTQTILRIMI